MNDPAKPSSPEGQTDRPQAPAGAEPAAAGAGNAAGAAPQPGDPAGDPVALAARIKELEGQQADLTDRLLRAHAEMENVRKRTEREKLDTAKFAISKFATDIVNISDNFQRAISAVPAAIVDGDANLKALVEGVQLTEREFLKVLERHGVRRIDPMGEPFDPNRHQAVSEIQNPEVPAGSVVQVFQVGYLIEERVLRPAMVVIARGGAKSPRPASAASAANDDAPGETGAAGGNA